MTDDRIAEKELSKIVEQGWSEAMKYWGNPSIPRVVNVKTDEECSALGNEGVALRSELAFMNVKTFQTYANLKNIEEKLKDLKRGYRAVTKHEIGHRYCPHDAITSFFLAQKAEKALENAKCKNPKQMSPYVLNLFLDSCINTRIVRDGDNDIPWVYEELCKKDEQPKNLLERVLGKKKQSNENALWRVYVHGYELLWNKKMLPQNVTLSEEEQKAAENLAGLFRNKNPMDKNWWEEGISEYACILAPFLKNEEDAKNAGVFDNTGAESIPKGEDLKDCLGEIARRLCECGQDGLPTKSDAVKEFREILAGIGEGDPVKASINFYEQLASHYTVKFAAKQFGRPRTSPFSLQKWSPSDPISDLDVQQSVLTQGVLVPGVTTQKWKARTTNMKGGEYEIIPTLDILIDSSGSMPNPAETVSLPVLAGFVAARRAQKQGVRVLNYSNNCTEVPRTNNLAETYAGLVLYKNGGTVFPVTNFLGDPKEDPRLSLIITDTFFANTSETVEAIKQFRKRNKQNRVTIYAITELPNAEELTQAGAECIHGTTPNIFKHILGKTESTYLQ